MAIFQMQISSLARSAGRRATAAAAYRSGERLRDERSGELVNHSRRRDVTHTEIFLPAQFDGQPVAWARARESLWNAAEHTEKGRNARVAREYQVSLPHELDASQRVALARQFSREIAERYRVAVDLAVHEPRPGSDPRNHHAHLLTTTREVTPTGLAAKAGIDMSAAERRRHGLPDHSREYVALRERWAQLTNEALREANVSARVDHRSLAAQGIDREPQPRIPLMQLKMEQRGVRSELAERLRQQYRARVEQRTERTERAAQAVARGREAGADAASRPLPPAWANREPRSPARDLEEVRRQAREAWLKLRAAAVAQPARDSATRESPARAAVRDDQARDSTDDLAL
ncbi:MAG: MobA/MobL family protein [Proteobacteria bacterium]|nr:MobA/MobL family protein [Pseudomonadota bacterium]